MSSVLRHISQNVSNSAMKQNDLSMMSTYTVTLYDAQNQLYYNNSSDIQIVLPSKTTAKWQGFPMIYITNMSPTSAVKMTFNFATGVKVKAPTLPITYLLSPYAAALTAILSTLEMTSGCYRASVQILMDTKQTAESANRYYPNLCIHFWL